MKSKEWLRGFALAIGLQREADFSHLEKYHFYESLEHDCHIFIGNDDKFMAFSPEEFSRLSLLLSASLSEHQEFSDLFFFSYTQVLTSLHPSHHLPSLDGNLIHRLSPF